MDNPLSDTQLSTLKQALLLEQQQLQAQIQHSFELLNVQNNNELSKFDNHQADYATELFELTRDFFLHEQLMTSLEQTETALAQLESDSYGYCQLCQQPISYKRLEANPAARYCTAHQPISEQPQITATTGHFYESNNDNRDANFFDGEDTNQSLYSYGTSSISQYQNYNYEFAAEFDDATQNGVELLEDFIATDITGKNVFVLRNSAYKSYVHDVDQQLEEN